MPFEDGELAAREIERSRGNSRFVAVEMPVLTREPMGSSRYWKMYEAAAAYGLPIIVHVAGYAGVPTMGGVGWGSYFIESHGGWIYPFQAHVVSLLHSGVFERIPQLQIILTEGGFTWMPSLMWRLDRTWRLMPEEWAGSKESPSHDIRKHFWFTTQPIDEPDKPEYFTQVLKQMDMNDRILFSSDYPHWDFDAPDLALPRTVSRTCVTEFFDETPDRCFASRPRVE